MPEPAEDSATAYLEIRLSGSGGQGIILAATLLGDACAQAGRQVVQTQSYGPEARGGASKAEVIVSDREIDFPEVRLPDLTLCLSQAAFDQYAHETRAGGLVVADTGLIHTDGLVSDASLAGAPFTEIATTQLGKSVATNVVALGAVLALTGLAPPEAVQRALRRRLPEKIVALNLRALDLGREAMEAAGAV
jgi:2-oxoglutarate ferredoxin oxidoreductase subunit gamma